VTLEFLLDTSIVSAAISKVPNPDVVRRLEENGSACAIASVVWHELLYGCARLVPSQRRAMLEAFVQDVVKASFPILPYDDNAAVWHAAERVRLEAIGKPPPFVDGQIAAVAFSQGLTLVTANPRDFRPFAGIEIQDWTKRTRGRS